MIQVECKLKNDFSFYQTTQVPTLMLLFYRPHRVRCLNKRRKKNEKFFSLHVKRTKVVKNGGLKAGLEIITECMNCPRLIVSVQKPRKTNLAIKMRQTVIFTSIISAVVLKTNRKCKYFSTDRWWTVFNGSVNVWSDTPCSSFRSSVGPFRSQKCPRTTSTAPAPSVEITPKTIALRVRCTILHVYAAGTGD